VCGVPVRAGDEGRVVGGGFTANRGKRVPGICRRPRPSSPARTGATHLSTLITLPPCLTWSPCLPC